MSNIAMDDADNQEVYYEDARLSIAPVKIITMTSRPEDQL